MLCDRLVEVSLTATPTNAYSRATGVTAVQGVKSIGGVWVPALAAAEYKSLIGQRDGHEYLADRLAAARQHADDLEAIEHIAR